MPKLCKPETTTQKKKAKRKAYALDPTPSPQHRAEGLHAGPGSEEAATVSPPYGPREVRV